MLLNLGIQHDQDLLGGDLRDGTRGKMIVFHGSLDNVESTGGELANLGQGGSLLDRLHTRLELGEESTGLSGIVDQLGQILHNDHSLAKGFLGSSRGIEGSSEQGGQHGQHGGCDDGDEGGLRQSVDRLLKSLGGGILHILDQKGKAGGNVVVGQEGGESSHGLARLLGYFTLQVVHAGLDNGNELLEGFAHSITQQVLLSLLVHGTLAQLRLDRHLFDKRVGTDKALPLARSLGQIALESGDQTVDHGLGAETAEEGINGVLRRITDDGTLVRQGIQSKVEDASVVQEENGFTEREFSGVTLEQSTDNEHGTLALGGILLIGSRLANIGENIVVQQTGCAGALDEQVGQGICAIKRLLGGVGSVDGVQK